MLKRIEMLGTKAYVKGTVFMNNLKKKGQEFLNDQSGLSGVVVAVMLILISVLLIAAMWGSLSKWLKQLWGQITGAGQFDSQTW